MILDKPLSGKKIMITRPKEQASKLISKFKKLGAKVILCPVIKIVPLKNGLKRLDMAIKNINSYDMIIFSSANSVRLFFDRFKTIYKNTRCIKNVKICSVGPATGTLLYKNGISVSFMPVKYNANGILRILRNVENKKILIPKAKVGGGTLVKELKKKKAIVDSISIYNTVKNKIKIPLEDGEINAITFTSPSTVNNFFALLKHKKKKLLDKIALISIGPSTTSALKKKGYKNIFQASNSTVDDMVDIIKNIFPINN